jgi:hypothetical protein
MRSRGRWRNLKESHFRHSLLFCKRDEENRQSRTEHYARVICLHPMERHAAQSISHSPRLFMNAKSSSGILPYRRVEWQDAAASNGVYD